MAREPVLAPASPVPRRTSLALIACVAAALATAAFVALAPLPLDVREEAAAASPGDLPPAARLLALLFGCSQTAWRALGAAGVGLIAAAAGALARRMSASRVVAAVVALAAGTHALALACAAHVRGSLSLLALACAGLALALGGRATSRRAAAVGLVALAFLLFPREAAFTSAGDLLVLALNRSPGASGTAIAGGAAVLAGMVAALVRSRASRRAAVAGLAAAIAFAAMGVGTAAREIGATRPARAEARRFLARLDSVPPMTAGAGLDFVVNAPGGTDAVARARPSRPFARAPEALGTGFALRLMKWAPPADDGLLAMQPPDLFPVIAATVDPGIRLLAPADGATLAARSAEDEPEFRFVPGAVAHDHGDCCHGGLKVIILSSEGTRTRVIARDLDEAILRHEGTPDAPVLVWKPAWRPMDCPERELRWEDGEVCSPGGTFWWTIAVAGEDGARIAPFRRGFVLP